MKREATTVERVSNPYPPNRLVYVISPPYQRLAFHRPLTPAFLTLKPESPDYSLTNVSTREVLFRRKLSKL